MKPRVSVITLGVDDLERAVRFYRVDAAGGGQQAREPREGQRLVVDEERAEAGRHDADGGGSGSEIETTLPPSTLSTSRRPPSP